jgi:hypothetical protein
MTLFITSNLEKHNLIQTDSFTTKLNAKFPWPPIMPKQHEYILPTVADRKNIYMDFIMYFVLYIFVILIPFFSCQC